MPIMMHEQYTRPFFDKWQPLIDSLPGNTNGLTTKAYLHNWAEMAKGKHNIGAVSDVVDRTINQVENSIGKSITNPDFLGRLAGRVGMNIYRGTLGFALDTATTNMFQVLNTFAETGRVTKGIYHQLASSDVNRLIREVPKDVGILKEMSYHIFEGGERAGVGFNKWLADKLKISEERLDKLDDAVTKAAFAPMQFTENVLRGTAFAAAVDEAVAMGLDHQTSLRLGIGRQSQIMPNLRLTEAHVEALAKVAKTQFAYEKEFQSPYTQGSLLRLSTIFWSYPTKQLQFLSNGLARAMHDTYMHRDYESASRMTRYLALTGLFVGGVWLGSKVGVNLANAFGSGLFPRTAPLVLQPFANMYQMVSGREPLKDKQWTETWKNLVYMLGVPGARYGGKLYDAIDSATKGYEADNYGRKLYNTTGWGEFGRAFGIEAGQLYNNRQIARTLFENGAKMHEERLNAISAYVNKGDQSLLNKYNERWGTKYPGAAITGDDVVNWARNAQKSLPERLGTKGMRRVEQEAYGYQP